MILFWDFFVKIIQTSLHDDVWGGGEGEGGGGELPGLAALEFTWVYI